jgi:hypothetical protein
MQVAGEIADGFTAVAEGIAPRDTLGDYERLEELAHVGRYCAGKIGHCEAEQPAHFLVLRFAGWHS